MMIKQYLPFRFSRDGWIPDRLRLHSIQGSADEWEKELIHKKKTIHYHVAADGTVTALTPLSAAATYRNNASKDHENGKREVVILIEGDACSKEQADALLRLLKAVQKEILRIYGQPFPLSRSRTVCDGSFPLEELLEFGYVEPQEKTVYRVQTGNYRSRADAEDSVERLQKAGIAAYITEVAYG